MRPVSPLALSIPALLLLVSGAASAQTLVMNHSGYLLDGSDQPVSNASLPMVFRVFNVRDLHGTGENLIWESKPCNVTVSRGFYAVTLGETCPGATPLQASHIPPNETRYLEVQVNGVALTPRLLLGTVPNAVMASVAQEAKQLNLATGAKAGLALVSDANGHGGWALLGSSAIADGALVDANVSPTAGIATSKLAGPLTAVANNGLGALATKSAVGDAEIPADAAISTSKLSGAVTAIANNGLGALATKGTVADADVAAGAAIATSKLAGPIAAIAGNGLGALATKSAVADADVAAGAAIAGTKISPDFGSANVVTTGSVGVGIGAPIGKLDVRNNGRGVLWGHQNPDYRSDLGALSVAGNPYLAFHGLHSASANTIQRDGTGDGPMVFMHDNAAGLTLFGAPAGPANADVTLTPVASFKATGAVGIATASPAAKLDVNGDARVNGPLTVNGSIHGALGGGGYRILSTDWVNISGLNCGSNPTGYLKLVTPIVHNESNMFSIHITFYGYGAGGFAGDIRCGGYAYDADTLINAGCTSTGVSFPVAIAAEQRGAKKVVVIKIGSPSQAWYYQHFSYDYVGWTTHTPSQFQWVCGETN